jgi:hypothetical protein
MVLFLRTTTIQTTVVKTNKTCGLLYDEIEIKIWQTIPLLEYNHFHFLLVVSIA